MCSSRARFCLALISVLFGLHSTTQAKVMLHAHFDGTTANADYALGDKKARSALPNSNKVAGILDGGRWGRALDATKATANCTFDAARNFNPKRGTAEMWFRIQEHEEGMYHPLFGWFRPPHLPGAKKRQSAMYVYLHNSVMVLGRYTPKHKSTLKVTPVKVGRWHHLEVNWNCERGHGQSVYNVFLDGKSLIRIVDGGAFEDGDGAQLHVGIWDYAFSHRLRGRIDELRITDQVEHLKDFDPPTSPHATPGTINYAKVTHSTAIKRLKQFNTEIELLMTYSGAIGGSDAARAIRESQAIAKEVARTLESLNSSLGADNPNVPELCTAVDAIADRLSTARLPVHQITAKAAALSATEDRRSLLFKDLNNELVGDAVILNGRQLFVDDYVIENTKGLKRETHAQLVKKQLGKLEAQSTRGSLLYDSKERQFKLWFVGDSNRKNPILCFAVSRNGLDWQKPKNSPPLKLGRKVSFYEQGIKAPRFDYDELLKNGLVLTTTRRDGFVSINAENAGVLTTRRFVAIGDTLVLNAQATNGNIRVEAIDALGRVIKGFSKDACRPITGDNTKHVVSWADSTNCHSLQARPIKLRIYMNRAKLFSFEFRIRNNHYVPNTYRQ